eukprot:1338343-Amorphochlora_amoeboformis.AAC.1
MGWTGAPQARPSGRLRKRIVGISITIFLAAVGSYKVEIIDSHARPTTSFLRKEIEIDETMRRFGRTEGEGGGRKMGIRVEVEGGGGHHGGRVADIEDLGGGSGVGSGGRIGAGGGGMGIGGRGRERERVEGYERVIFGGGE